MTGAIVQINISPGGVPKLPIPEGAVHSLGIEGDGHTHADIHGGPRQALLFIAEEALDQLKTRGYPVFAGALGENITTRGIDPRNWRIGQRWRVGPEVIIEITKVRSPCRTLHVYGDTIGAEIYDKQVKAGDVTSPRWGASGVYASVVVSGTIRTGDGLALLDEIA